MEESNHLLPTPGYQCQCGKPIFFRNSFCLYCGTPLGFEPSLGRVFPLEEAGPGEYSLIGYGEGGSFERCANAETAGGCNWLVSAEDVAAGKTLCIACRLNRTIPNLSTQENAEYWRLIEQAKRRLVAGLLALGLPVQSKICEDPACGLAFDFLESQGGPVKTGHEDGVITLNIAEANDATREQIRNQMHEPYRTLLGHFRHESGHYYWDLLVRDGEWLEPFRELFGDEQEDYATALQRHYNEGPRPDWRLYFVSAYASSHPWEDWAETWAHYMHMHDGLTTAARLHLDLHGVEMPFDAFTPDVLMVGDEEFLGQLNDWMRFSAVLNEFARSMGQADFYPFILSTESVRKLHFAHRVIQAAGVRGREVVGVP